MARRSARLTDAQLRQDRTVAPTSPAQAARGGRPSIGNRAVVDRILWVLKADAR